LRRSESAEGRPIPPRNCILTHCRGNRIGQMGNMQGGRMGNPAAGGAQSGTERCAELGSGEDHQNREQPSLGRGDKRHVILRGHKWAEVGSSGAPARLRTARAVRDT